MWERIARVGFVGPHAVHTRLLYLDGVLWQAHLSDKKDGILRW